jgi:hypothetical protein
MCGERGAGGCADQPMAVHGSGQMQRNTGTCELAPAARWAALLPHCCGQHS